MFKPCIFINVLNLIELNYNSLLLPLEKELPALPLKVLNIVRFYWILI